MRKVLKRILFLAALPLILAGILLLISWLYRDKIASLVLEEINQKVEAKVDIDSYSLSPFRRFPDMNLSIEGLSISGVELFRDDTLLFVDDLQIEIDLWSLVRPPYRIESVILEESVIHARVLEDGAANWSILSSGEASGRQPENEAPLEVLMAKFALHDATIIYNDLEADIFSLMEQVEARFLIQGDKPPFWKSSIMISSWDAKMEGMNIMQKMKANFEGELDFNLDSFKMEIIDSRLHLNEMPYSLVGFFEMPDSSINLDFVFHSDKASFKDLLSMVPIIYRHDFDNLEASGDILFGGRVSGTYDADHFPTTDLNLSVEKGSAQWSDLPQKISDVNLKLSVRNEEGTLQGTILDLSQLQAFLGNDQIDFKLYLEEPDSDPLLQSQMFLDLDLNNWESFIPVEILGKLSGKILASISYKGRVSNVSNKYYERIEGGGSMDIKDFSYDGPLFAQEIKLDRLLAQLTPNDIQITEMNVTSGRSNLNIEGNASNYLQWTFSEGVLETDLELTSSMLDLNSLKIEGQTSAGTDVAKDSLSSNLPDIPDNIIADIKLDIASFEYDSYKLEDLKGMLKIRAGKASLDPVFFKMLGGKMKIKGDYDPDTENSYAFVNVNMDFDNVALDQTFSTFNTIQKLAPMASLCSGDYSAALKIRGNLFDDFSPELASINGLLRFSTEKLMIDQAEVIKQIGGLTGSSYFDSPTLSKVNALIEFKNGAIKVKPFSTKIKKADVLIGGGQGLDGTIDYEIQVALPSDELQLEKSMVAQKLFELPLAKTVKLDWPEILNIGIDVEGKLSEPRVSLNIEDQLKKLKEETVDKIRDKAENEFEKKRAELILKAEVQANLLLDEANRKGDELVQEAQRKADQIKSFANSQIDQVMAEADKKANELINKAGANPIKKLAAQEAAELIRTEAQKKADQIKAESAIKADQMVELAEKQKESLVQQARKEGEKLISEARTKKLP